MAVLPESSDWEVGIYQLEITDPVQGGSGGVSNLQPNQLANRTLKIHDVLEENGIFITGSHEYKGQNIITAAVFEGSVADGDLVYRNTTLNQFEKALADGTNKENVVGIANVTGTQVFAGGLIDLVVGGASAGDTLYLSDTTPGATTTTQTSKSIGKYLYDDIIFLSTSGVGGNGTGTGSTEGDVYSDLLNTSQYSNITFNIFDTVTASDTLIDSTDMDHDVVESLYDFTVGEIITSTDLFDATSGVSPITEAMISIDFTDDGTPTIEMTADGGSNWETVTNNQKHTFTNTGTDLRLRFTGGGTGQIKSWGVLYNPDSGALQTFFAPSKLVNFYYEATAIDEDIIIDGIYFDTDVIVGKITINSRIAPIGSDLTVDITKDGVEETNLSTLTDGSSYETTSVTPVSFSNSERFGLKIKSVGSTEAGQGLNLTVHYSDK